MVAPKLERISTFEHIRTTSSRGYLLLILQHLTQYRWCGGGSCLVAVFKPIILEYLTQYGWCGGAAARLPLHTIHRWRARSDSPSKKPTGRIMDKNKSNDNKCNSSEREGNNADYQAYKKARHIIISSEPGLSRVIRKNSHINSRSL